MDDLHVDTYDLISPLKPRLKAGPTVVLANGCFDILHRGHIEHLIHASYMGDVLIVSLTTDDKVNKGAGRPINNWSDRAYVLFALKFVDDVVETESACDAIRRIRPDVFVKGIDYADGKHFTEDVEAACKEVGAELRYTDSPKRSVKDMILRASA